MTDEEEEEVCVVCDSICLCKKRRKRSSSLTSIIGSLSDLSLSPVSMDFGFFTHDDDTNITVIPKDTVTNPSAHTNNSNSNKKKNLNAGSSQNQNQLAMNERGNKEKNMKRNTNDKSESHCVKVSLDWEKEIFMSSTSSESRLSSTTSDSEDDVIFANIETVKSVHEMNDETEETEEEVENESIISQYRKINGVNTKVLSETPSYNVSRIPTGYDEDIDEDEIYGAEVDEEDDEEKNLDWNDTIGDNLSLCGSSLEKIPDQTEEDIGELVHEDEWGQLSSTESLKFIYSIHGNSFDEDETDLENFIHENEDDDGSEETDEEFGDEQSEFEKKQQKDRISGKMFKLKTSQFPIDSNHASSLGVPNDELHSYHIGDLAADKGHNKKSTPYFKEDSETEEEEIAENNSPIQSHIMLDSANNIHTFEDVNSKVVSLPELVKEATSSEEQDESSPKPIPIPPKATLNAPQHKRPPLLNIPPFFSQETMKHFEQFSVAYHRHSGMDPYHPMATAAALAAFNSLNQGVFGNHYTSSAPPYTSNRIPPPQFPLSARQNKTSLSPIHPKKSGSSLPPTLASDQCSSSTVQKSVSQDKVRNCSISNDQRNLLNKKEEEHMNVSVPSSINKLHCNTNTSTNEIISSSLEEKQNNSESVLERKEYHQQSRSRHKKKKVRPKPKLTLKIEDVLDIRELLEDSDSDASIYVPTEWVRWQKVPIGSYLVHRNSARGEEPHHQPLDQSHIASITSTAFNFFLPSLQTTLVPASNDESLISPIFPSSFIAFKTDSKANPSSMLASASTQSSLTHTGSSTQGNLGGSNMQSKWQEAPFNSFTSLNQTAQSGTCSLFSNSTTSSPLDPPSRVINFEGHQSLISYLSTTTQEEKSSSKWKKTSLNELNSKSIYSSFDFKDFDPVSTRLKRKRRKKSSL